MASLTPTNSGNGSFEEVFSIDPTERSASPATLFADQLSSGVLSNPELMNFENLRAIFRTFGAEVVKAKSAELTSFQEKQVSIIDRAFQEGKQIGYKEGASMGYEQGLAAAEDRPSKQPVASAARAEAIRDNLDVSTQTAVLPVQVKLLQDAASQAVVLLDEADTQTLNVVSDSFTQVEREEQSTGTDPMSPFAAPALALATAQEELDDSGLSSLAQEIAAVSTNAQGTQTDSIPQSHVREIATVAASALAALAVGYASHNC